MCGGLYSAVVHIFFGIILFITIIGIPFARQPTPWFLSHETLFIIFIFVNTQIRKSYTELSKIYFWTPTIHDWLHLLEPEENKKVIISSLKKLSDDKLISVYAFIIMPNHIHLIWSQDGMNGKETPKGSFLKYTAHIFLRYLKTIGKSKLYEVTALNKSHEIWQRDSLGIEIYDKQ